MFTKIKQNRLYIILGTSLRWNLLKTYGYVDLLFGHAMHVKYGPRLGIFGPDNPDGSQFEDAVCDSHKTQVGVMWGIWDQMAHYQPIYVFNVGHLGPDAPLQTQVGLTWGIWAPHSPNKDHMGPIYFASWVVLSKIW